MDFSIGELGKLTGLPVKTIRYYSDIGLVPEARRTDAGYRRYDAAGLARLELVRTLRDLGSIWPASAVSRKRASLSNRSRQPTQTLSTCISTN
jgi:MerR family regulatory protein